MREGLTLAREPCDTKSNEITALPRLLNCMVLKGAVVTIDAAGTEGPIVQELWEAGTDHVLAVKRNQQTLHWKVKAAFDDAEQGAFMPRAKDRCATDAPLAAAAASGASVADPREWPGLHSLIRVQAEHTGPRGYRSYSVRTASPAGSWMRRPCWNSSAATSRRPLSAGTACTTP